MRVGALLVALPCLANCEAGEDEPVTGTSTQASMAEACGAGLPPEGSAAADGERIAGASQALFGSRASNYFWGDADTAAANNTLVNTRTDIPVCWESDPNALPGFTTPQILAYLDSHRALVERTWSRYARINMTGWGACTSATQPGIHVRLCSASSAPWTNPNGSIGTCPGGGWVGVNNTGLNGAGINGKPNGVRFNTSQMDAVFVHEFGHALGFIHDEVRHSASGGSEFDGTYPCAGQMGDGASIYTIAQFSQPVPSLSNAVTYGGINWGTNAGNTGFPYQWSSIMAYCRNPVDRPAPFLSHYDVAGLQRIYGRRQQGTLLSTRAHCTEASATQVFLSGANCDEFANVQEFPPVLSDSDQWNLRTTSSDGSTRCIAPTSVADGAAVTPQTCSTSTDWRFQNMLLVGFGGMCLDLSNGSLTAGNAINVQSCGLNLANQVWTRTRHGQIKFGTTNWCAQLDSAAGGRLRLQACDSANSRQIFSFSSPGAGQISRWNGSANECLDVSGPSDAQFHPTSGYAGSGGPNAGAAVNAVACNSALNQRWNLSGALRYGADANLCLHRDSEAGGTSLTLRTCAFTEAQVWDYYF